MDATLLVPIGLGITVIGAALGIGKFAAAAAEAPAQMTHRPQGGGAPTLCPTEGRGAALGGGDA